MSEPQTWLLGFPGGTGVGIDIGLARTCL